MNAVIHTNAALLHQMDFAQAFQDGLSAHGIDATVTTERDMEGDLHIVLGPWYALEQWKHERILYLDRCFYGDARWSASIGWRNPDGSRDFMNTGMAAPKGDLPELKPRKTERGAAFVFGDYGADPNPAIELARSQFPRVYFRPHPQDQVQGRKAKALQMNCSLDQVWNWAVGAVGGTSTVLVEAELNGMQVHSTDPNHVVHYNGAGREQWLVDLSWAQWAIDEVASGAFWEHLKP